MGRTIATLAFFVFAIFAIGAAHRAAHGARHGVGDGVADGLRDGLRHRGCARGTHIRAAVPALGEALDAGVGESATLRALVDEIEASDVLVYLTFDFAPAAVTAGHISLMAAAGGCRYLRLAVNPRYDEWRRVGILAHELRHGVEIARDASVIDQRSLASLYRRIGYSSGERSFESAAAIAAGEQVFEELRPSRRAPAAPRPGR